MRLHILCIGNRPPAWAKLAFDDYAKRFPKPYTLQLTEIPTPNRNAYSVSQAKALEWEKMQRYITPQSGIIALDEKGHAWPTTQLAEQLKGWQTEFKQLCFLIGGPDGLTQECLKQAHMRWSLSKLTLRHVLARIIAVEQLYRCITLINQHPYHRA